jgi:hypothetical protein
MRIPSRVSAIAVLRVMLVLAIALGTQLGSCSKPARPPSHPDLDMRDRAATRIQLVSLIIDDPQRAAQVRSAYERIETLGVALEKTRMAEAKQLLELSGHRVLPENEIRTHLWKLREAGKAAYPKYVELQLEIRKLTTPKEFAKLDEVR